MHCGLARARLTPTGPRLVWTREFSRPEQKFAVQVKKIPPGPGQPPLPKVKVGLGSNLLPQLTRYAPGGPPLNQVRPASGRLGRPTTLPDPDQPTPGPQVDPTPPPAQTSAIGSRSALPLHLQHLLVAAAVAKRLA